VRLFQIEEPDGEPVDPGAAGAAIAIDASSSEVEVAFSVGGNALILSDREGFERVLTVPGIAAGKAEWQAMIEAARTRAERGLGRPVTHAVIVLARALDTHIADRLREAAHDAGLMVLCWALAAEMPGGSSPALGAAMLAEDLAPPLDRNP
jgi:hypothetical protein